MANDVYGTFSSKVKIPYDPLWKGPLQINRHCTNRLWFIVFSACIVAWAIVIAYAFSNGDVQKLIVPTDSEGRKCGIDPDVQNKPYLIFFDLNKCVNGTCDTTQVCRESCPTENFVYQKDTQLLEDVKKKIICKIDINMQLINSFDQIDYYIAQNKCAKWYLNSETLQGRCIPKAPIPSEFDSLITNKQLNNSKHIILEIANLEKSLEDIYHDVTITGYPVFGFIALSGLMAFFYIILLKWLAKPVVYASIIITCGFLVYFIYFSSTQYAATNSSKWLYALILCIIMFITVTVLTILLSRKIDLACEMIKESSKAVTCIWSSLFFPILPWIFHLLVITLAIGVWFNLKTITIPNYQVSVQELVPNSCVCPPGLNYVNNETCNPDTFKAECKDANGGPCLSSGCYLISTKVPEHIYLYHIINALVFMWLMFFVSAFGQMVLAVTFATWYWTFTKINIPNFTLMKSFWITFRYHMGTLAFGSLITWFCDLIRVILKPIDKITQSDSAINFVSMNFIRPSISYIMSFIKYVNRNAYIMCAIHGKSYCYAAKDAFNLIMRNVMQVFVITYIIDWLLKIARYFIIMLTIILAMIYYSNKESDIHNIEVPVVMVLIGSYLITSVFFTVFKTAVDTLFLCFLEDLECNDDSIEKPYFMSMKLKQLLKN